MHEILKLCLIALLAFLFLFVLAKVMGKKQIAQLNFVDYAIGISLGSIAAEMAFDLETPFYYFLISMTVFFAFALLFNILERKGPFFKRLLKGKPAVVIYEGKLDYHALKKAGLDVNDLLLLARGKDYFDLSAIYYAIVETNGTLSVMPIGPQRPLVASDMLPKPQPASLPNYLIADGRLSYSGLEEAGLTREMLLEKLHLNKMSEIKSIILASYDDTTQEITVHYKN